MSIHQTNVLLPWAVRRCFSSWELSFLLLQLCPPSGSWMIILYMLFRKVSKILDLVGSTGVDAPGICGNGMVMMMLVLYRWIFRAEFGMNTSGDCTWCRCCTVAEAQLQGLQWSQRSAVGGKFKRHRKQGVELEKRSFGLILTVKTFLWTTPVMCWSFVT